jgi:EAL domain-containing protein (putative c-di-GMP-specific phosphodiesterase class I)
VGRKVLDAIAPPAMVDGEEVRVTASLGMAIYPKDAVDGATLVQQADRAMYRAKAEGGNLCRFASDQLERRVQRGALLEADLRRGLEQGELLLHYQPQVALAPGVLGVAAMVRWAHPELGLIGPERFLPLAEDSGLLEGVTEWLLEGACRQADRWRRHGLDRVQLAVPLWSRQQLLWGGLVEQLDDRLRRLSLAPEAIEIELAEEFLLADAEVGGAAAAALEELGVRLALDGYGRGSTSLKGLQLAVLDTVKLARELLQDVPEDGRRGALLEAIITLARELGLRVVAEGVEREAQLEFLRHHHCDAVQAFMSCPPLPAEACTNWLEQAAGRRPAPPVELPREEARELPPPATVRSAQPLYAVSSPR